MDGVVSDILLSFLFIWQLYVTLGYVLGDTAVGHLLASSHPSAKGLLGPNFFATPYEATLQD